MEDWTTDQVLLWVERALADEATPDIIATLKQGRINWRSLVQWTDSTAISFRIPPGVGMSILHEVKRIRPTAASSNFVLSTKNATPNARKLLLSRLVTDRTTGPATLSEWWSMNKPSHETQFFPAAAFNATNLYKPEWLLQPGAAESTEVQPKWATIVAELNKHTNLTSQPAYRFKQDSIGTRRPNVPAYLVGKPRTEFYMSFINENKGGLLGDDFTNEHKGHIASFMEALLSMTVRDFVIGCLNDCRIIKFFKGKKDGSNLVIQESPTYFLVGDGGKLLSYLLTAQPLELGFTTPSVMLNNREVIVNSQLGHGGCSVVYQGNLGLDKVAVKLYSTDHFALLENERHILTQLAQLEPFVPKLVGTSNDRRALILSPVATPFFDIGIRQGLNCVPFESCHAVHLVDLLERVHALGIVHRDIKPANYFQHPIEPNKVYYHFPCQF